MNNEQNNTETDSPVLTKWQALAFSSPVMGQIFLMGPMGVVQGIYAKYFGMALTTLAAVLLVGRIFDALTDPLIGHFSDRYRVHKTTRKPFVLFGGLLVIPCSYFLFVPPADVGVSYFMLWTLLFYLSSTLLSIPMNAWGSEISSNSVERTTLFTVMMLVGQIGGVLFFLVPFLPMFTTTEITPETLKLSVWVGAVLILPGLFCALKFVPDGPAPLEETASVKDKPKGHVFHSLLNAVK